MTPGHYLSRNAGGTTIDIDADALPKTDKAPNIALPNIHVEMPSGRIWRTEVPRFRIDPATDRLLLSTNYTEREDAWVGAA